MGKIVPAGNLEELHCRCVRVTVTANTNKHIEKSRGKPAVCVVYTLTLYVQVAVKREVKNLQEGGGSSFLIFF